MHLRRKIWICQLTFLFSCFHFIPSPSDFCSQFDFQYGSCVSIYGCFYKHKTIDGNTVNQEQLDTEQGTYVAPTLDGTPELPNLYKNSNTNREPHARHIARVWGYIFQIIFQVIFFFFSGFYWSIYFCALHDFN